MNRDNHWAAALAIAVLLLFGNAAQASTAEDVVNVDLASLIDGAIGHPNRFAVDLPHRIDSNVNGEWVDSAANRIWRYSVRVPTAVSISFHADSIELPPSARLAVTAGGLVYRYVAKDINRGQLWSRVGKGDRLTFELTVPATDWPGVRLRIASLQAGYRSLDRGGINHPHYDALRKRLQLTQAATSSCIENYECDADAANQGPAQATVALLIANIGQCSGTLLNDVPGDGTPYVLTARHCESDTLGGGAPKNAANITIYWDATSACGQVLGTIYDPGIPSQGGASSVIEQQDAWLIRLDESPVVGDAFYAGWDATGAAITGGYTIHHANSNSKQYTSWYGQSILITVPGAQLNNLAYDSTFWGVVNQSGSIGPGASGSGLFNAGGLLVGSLSLGREQLGSGGGGVCPVTPLQAATSSNAAGEFTAFGAVFNSTADTTSSSGTATLQTVLDPQRTGVLSVIGAAGGGPLSFTVDSPTPSVGSGTYLHWSAPDSTGCTAADGIAGDGWSGSLAANGSASVNETTASVVTYSITCTVGARRLSAQLVVSWGNPRPVVGMTISRSYQWIGAPLTLQWFGNVSTCTLTGAGVNVTGLPATGSYSISETVPGSYQFTVSCGSGSQTSQAQQSATFYLPSVILTAATHRLVGEPFTINYEVYADSCIPSGGGTDPNWTGAVLPAGSSVGWITEPIAGTYTYTLTCTSGTVSAQGSVTVVVETGPPTLTLASSVGGTVAYGNPITLSWSSNVDNCIASETTANPSDQWNFGADTPDGSQVIQEPVVGTHTYSMTCGESFDFGTVQNQVTVNVIPSTTTATLTSSSSQVATGAAFTLTWDSTNAFICTGSGATTDTMWNAQTVPSGSFAISENTPGTYTYQMTCAAGSQSAVAQTIVTVTSASSGGGGTNTGSSGTGTGSGGTNTSSGGGGANTGGGGGALDRWVVLALASLLMLRLWGPIGGPLPQFRRH
jgi:hypothetical protein